MTPSVLHLVSTGHDLETAHGLRAIAEHSAGVRTIGPGGHYAHLLWAVAELRHGGTAGVDVIHAWDETSLTAALLAGGGRRIVFTVPAGFTNARGTGRLLRAAAVRRVTEFICTSPAQHRACVAAGLPAERCHLVRPPVGEPLPARDRVVHRARLGLAPDDFVMLTAGESTRAADHERAAWAGSILHVVDERYRVLLWGRGHRLDTAATLGHKLRQPRLVVAARRASEFEDLLPAADAMLVTARGPAPTLPVALAMAAGVPVVAVPRPELAKVLVDNVTAFTVPSTAPRQIAQRVLDLRADSAAAREVTIRARTHALDLFSPARFVKEISQVYERAMSARSNAVAGRDVPALA